MCFPATGRRLPASCHWYRRRWRQWHRNSDGAGIGFFRRPESPKGFGQTGGNVSTSGSGGKRGQRALPPPKGTKPRLRDRKCSLAVKAAGGTGWEKALAADLRRTRRIRKSGHGERNQRRQRHGGGRWSGVRRRRRFWKSSASRRQWRCRDAEQCGQRINHRRCLVVEQDADGGNSGGSNGGAGGTSGMATSSFTLTPSGDLSFTGISNASGGNGGTSQNATGSAGGVANASINLLSNGITGAVTATADANWFSGNGNGIGGAVNIGTGTGGAGAASTATVVATETASSLLTVNSYGLGGNGGMREQWHRRIRCQWNRQFYRNQRRLGRCDNPRWRRRRQWWPGR